MSKSSPESKKVAALKYEQTRDAAPRLVARDKGHWAEQILAIAREKNVPIMENPELSQMLIKLNQDNLIPMKNYQTVTKIYCFIRQLNNQNEKHYF